MDGGPTSSFPISPSLSLPRFAPAASDARPGARSRRGHSVIVLGRARARRNRIIPHTHHRVLPSASLHRGRTPPSRFRPWGRLGRARPGTAIALPLSSGGHRTRTLARATTAATTRCAARHHVRPRRRPHRGRGRGRGGGSLLPPRANPAPSELKLRRASGPRAAFCADAARASRAVLSPTFLAVPFPLHLARPPPPTPPSPAASACVTTRGAAAPGERWRSFPRSF